MRAIVLGVAVVLVALSGCRQIAPYGQASPPDQGVDHSGDAEQPILEGVRLTAAQTNASPFDVREFRIAKDGTKVVYVGDRGDVWVVTLASGENRRLSNINEDGDPGVYARLGGFSADGTRVTYAVGYGGIYSVDLAGQDTRELAAPSDVSLSGLLVAPGVDRLVYQKGIATSQAQLRSVKLDGSSPIEISASLSADRFDDVQLVDGQQTLAFRARVAGQYQLYLGTADGAQLVQLSGPSEAVSSYQVLPGAEQVLYTASNAAGIEELKLVDVVSGVRQLLSQEPPKTTTSISRSFFLAADGKTVVYRAVDSSDEGVLYAVDLAGNDHRRLAPSYAGIIGFALVGDRAVFTTKLELLAVSLAVPTSVQPLGPWCQFIGTPDGSRVIYASGSSQAQSLYVVGLDGQNRIQLDSATISTSLSSTVVTAKDELIYRASKGTVPSRIYAAALAGGGSRRIDGMSNAEGTVSSFALTPDEKRLVYIADGDVKGTNELYIVDVDSPSTPTKLNAALGSIAPLVSGWTWSADSTHLISVTSLERAAGGYDLYATKLDGLERKRLTPASILDLNLTQLADNHRPAQAAPFVLFQTGSKLSYRNELYAVDLTDASLTRLDKPPAGGFWGLDTALDSVDGQYVLYSGNAPSVDVGLNIVRRDGTGHQRLSQVVANGWLDASNFLAPRFMFAGPERVVYLMRIGDNHRLFSVKRDGSGRVELNAPLSGTEVVNWPVELSADGQQVLYSVSPSQVTPAKALYLASVEGTQRTLLTTFDGSAQSTSVAWRVSADLETIIVREPSGSLYTVQRDGSAKRSLSGPVATEGVVQDFLLAPELDSVVYCTKADSAGESGVYLVSLAGGAPTRLDRGGDDPGTRSHCDKYYVDGLEFRGQRSSFTYLAEQRALVYPSGESGEERLTWVDLKTLAARPVHQQLSSAVIPYFIISEGKRIVYGRTVASALEVRLAAVDGSTDQLLLRLSKGTFDVSPNGRWLLYTTPVGPHSKQRALSLAALPAAP